MRLTIPEGRVDWRTRGIWHPGPPISDQEFAAARHSLFSGAFTWPLMVAAPVWALTIPARETSPRTTAAVRPTSRRATSDVDTMALLSLRLIQNRGIELRIKNLEFGMLNEFQIPNS